MLCIDTAGWHGQSHRFGVGCCNHCDEGGSQLQFLFGEIIEGDVDIDVNVMCSG